MTKWLFTCCAMATLLAATSLASRAAPPATMLEAEADRLAASADGSVLVTFKQGVNLPNFPDRNTPSSFLQWDPTTNTLVRELTVDVDGQDGLPVTGMALSPDGKFAALACPAAGGLFVYDLLSGQRTTIPWELGPGFITLGFSADGAKLATLVSQGNGPAIGIIERATGTSRSVPLAGPAMFMGAACSPTDNFMVVSRIAASAGSRRGSRVVEVYDLDSARLIRKLAIDDAGEHLAFSGDGKLLAYPASKRVMLFDLQKQQLVADFTLAEAPADFVGFTNVVVDRSGKFLAARPSFTGKPELQVWNVATSAVIAAGPSITAAAFLPGGVLALGSAGRPLRFIDPATGQDAPPPFPKVELATVAAATDAATVLVQPASPAPGDTTMRTWASSNGKFTIEGQFVALEFNEVVIERSDGETIRVAIDKLSKADQDFVRAQAAPSP
jgi:WD40 repeat protein